MAKRQFTMAIILWIIAFFVAVIIISWVVLPEMVITDYTSQRATFFIMVAFALMMGGFGLSYFFITRRFNYRYTLSEDKQRLMAFAEPLLLAHGESFRYFYLFNTTKKQARRLLATELWQIKDKKTVLQDLTQIMADNDAIAIDENKNNPTFIQTRDYLIQVGFTADILDGLTSYLAWDVCRVVFGASLSVMAKYITEEDAWKIINDVTAVAVEKYDNWHEYIAAYALGRALALNEFTPWQFAHRKGSPFLLFSFKETAYS